MSAAPSTASAATGRNVAALLARAWRLRTTAAHLVPAEGPVVLVANHTAFLDQFLLVAASPRPVHVLTGPEALVPPFGRLLLAAGQVPYDVDAPDRAALATALGILADGGVVGVFPEGARGAGDVRHVHHEAAYLAARSGAPVVPVAILGSRPRGGARDALPGWRARIDVVFGAPVDVRVDGDPLRRAVVARSGERMRQVLADHVRVACARTGQELPGPIPGTSTSGATGEH
jgi:1-acyl-sn-glycerol-3-phosphate acyltransferase